MSTSRTPGRRPASWLTALGDPGRFRKSPSPQASDPLFADFTLEGSVDEEKSIFLKLNVSRVHYFDDRGREWTIRPAEGGAKARAAEILERAASSWREDLSDWPEKEMLEEQVLGAALALLHKAQLQLEPAVGDGEALQLRGVSDLPEERLPRSLQKGLRSKVAALLFDISRREFERDGVSYRTMEPGAGCARRSRSTLGLASSSKVPRSRSAIRCERETPGWASSGGRQNSCSSSRGADR